MTNHVDSQRESDSNSHISISRGSSINGPYRQEKVVNTFPQCHLVHSIIGAEETYSRSLFSAGHGFAFWDIPGSHIRGPTPLEQLEGMSLLGMSIGDIGIIDPNGEFIFGFNVFASAADPLHQGQVPDDFVEIQPGLDRANEVQVIPNYFKPGSIVASKGVNVDEISEEPLKISMWSTAREGALLVLPHGGSREDLKSTSRFTEYVSKHALEWYRYMCLHSRTSATTVPNGSLYLITGCDRAKAWSSLAFPSNWKNAGKRIEVTYEGEEFPCWAPSRWSREKSIGLVEGKGRHFCIFARGIRISISNRLWIRHLPYNPPEEASYYNILSTPIVGFRSKIARIRDRLLRNSGVLLSRHQKFPFHPSILISQILLEQHPTADIVLVEDSVWCNLAKDGYATLPEVLDWVVTAVMSCELVTVDRLVSLKPKTAAAATPSKANFVKDLLAKYADWRARTRVLRQAERILWSH
ncbi:hypothetical protein CPB84DRAFT_1846145 [Gymnopilus junonius]|uniref:Uncharacterized protein n=1 Tax=Gymnopilus junonius TaxID=109634 RepID=A0A9P5NQC2_GYMJU|nr:hypothetical protein CPB84DRAFT_1846145 [Gymnopilus junonius]